MLYVSFSFWLLRVESRDFSQAEKVRTACKVEEIHKMTTIFNQKDNLGRFWVHCKPIPVMKTGFSLCSISNRENPVFITGIPATENRFFPVWKYYTGKTLFWPSTGPVRDCSVAWGNKKGKRQELLMDRSLQSATKKVKICIFKMGWWILYM